MDMRQIQASVAAPEGVALWSPQHAALADLPLLDLGIVDRLLLRSVARYANSKVRRIVGLQHIMPDRDPFILALNHSTRLEALLVPALLMLMREGRRVHFIADWNFLMVPLVGSLYRRSGAIIVANKPAKPRFLNVLKPLLVDRTPALVQARRHLEAGRSLGIFPEGTVNRDPTRLLAGRRGAARLSLETGVSVVPAGIRFPTVPGGASIPEASPFEIVIGPAMTPPAAGRERSPQALAAWHETIMRAIAFNSQKQFGTGKEG